MAMRTLVLPPAAQRDPGAVQMISAWIAEKDLHCALNIGMWRAQGHDEPHAWGILLADVVRHLANAIQEQAGTSADKAAKSIVDAFLSELDSPTSKATGSFSPGHS